MTKTIKHPLRLSQTKIKARRRQLCLLNGIEKSWRVIQRDYYPEVTYQTLNRFATDKKYIPVSDEVRKALDLYADPNPYKMLPKWYKRIPEALAYFTDTRHRIKGMYDEAKRQVAGER